MTGDEIRQEFDDIIAKLQTKTVIQDLANFLASKKAKFNKAEDDLQRQQLVAEVKRVLKVCDSGATVVIATARAGQDYVLGSQTIRVDPLAEPDILYLDASGQIRIDEIAHVAHGLRDKAKRSTPTTPGQFDNLVAWRANNPGVEIQYVIDNEQAWTEIFGRNKDEAESAAERMIGNSITLVIGSHTLAPATLRSLFDSIQSRFAAYKAARRCKNWTEYFALMPTVQQGIDLANSPPPPPATRGTL
jgi:hypothetical protein